MTRRITITLSDTLVEAIDDEAEEGVLSRSAVIREASARYVAGLQDRDAQARRHAAVGETVGLLEELMSSPPIDDRCAGDVLRELRGPLGDLSPWDDEVGEGP